MPRHVFPDGFPVSHQESGFLGPMCNESERENRLLVKRLVTYELPDQPGSVFFTKELVPPSEFLFFQPHRGTAIASRVRPWTAWADHPSLAVARSNRGRRGLGKENSG